MWLTSKPACPLQTAETRGNKVFNECDGVIVTAGAPIALRAANSPPGPAGCPPGNPAPVAATRPPRAPA